MLARFILLKSGLRIDSFQVLLEFGNLVVLDLWAPVMEHPIGH